MVTSAEMPTQIQPTVPAPPAPPAPGLTPRDPTPRTGGPGGPPRPPKRPTGGSGGGGGGGDDSGPGDPNGDAARKRLTLIVAGIGVVILIVLFVVLSNKGSDDATVTSPSNFPITTETITSPKATPTPTPTPAKATTPASAPASTPATTPASTTPATSPGSSSGGVAIDGGDSTAATSGPLLQAGKVTKIKVNQGQTVSFQVKSDTAQEVHVHGYDNKYELAAGETKSISFKATITGIFDIEFEDTSTQIGELTVDP